MQKLANRHGVFGKFIWIVVDLRSVPYRISYKFTSKPPKCSKSYVVSFAFILCLIIAKQQHYLRRLYPWVSNGKCKCHSRTVFLATNWSLKIYVSEKVQKIRDETCWESNCAEWSSSFTCWSATRSWPFDPLTFHHTADCLHTTLTRHSLGCRHQRLDVSDVHWNGVEDGWDSCLGQPVPGCVTCPVNKLAGSQWSKHAQRRSMLRLAQKIRLGVVITSNVSVCNDDFPNEHTSKLSRAANGDSSGNIIL